MLGIIQRFAAHGYQIDPDAIELIKSYPGEKKELVDYVLRDLDSSVVVVRTDHIKSSDIMSKIVSDRSSNSQDALPSESIRDEQSLNLQVEIDGPVKSESFFDVGRAEEVPARGLVTSDEQSRNKAYAPPSKENERSKDRYKVEVLSDITGRSTCVGEYGDFVKYFRDRYGKLREILSGRMNARPIESLGRNTAGREISIIGIVLDIRTTQKGHRIVELEDPTGMATVIIQNGSSAFDQSSFLVTDEVIGVSGTTDGNGRVFANSIIWPDLQSPNASLDSGDGAALFLSDLHIGSKFFLEDAWYKFVDWMCGGLDDPMGLLNNVRYLVVAGDLVDGIGVYPGQESDLAIMDVYEQYERAASYLSEIPDDICIVISPGNHDAVRQAEPQPALPLSVQGLFDKNVLFVGNPAWLSVGGRTCLVYHGRSIDDFVLKVPGISYSEPEKAMVEMLKRRHLSPIYGSRVSVAPEAEDHLLVQSTPAILHCGHVHRVGITRYKGVTVINSGTWQSQTEFQKKVNLQPTPGIVPYVDLETMRVRKLQFA